MSKKDLLERLTRVPADPVRAPRREDEVPGGIAADAVQTRVSRKVVRRRRKADEAPATVVRRRPAVEEPPPPVEASVDVVADAAPPIREPDVRVEEAPRAVDPAPAPEPDDRPAEPVVTAAPSVVEEVPAPSSATDASDAPASEAVAEAPESPPEPIKPGPGRVPNAPDKPAFPGLGPAVVSPPPGYDPSNPMAYRRRQEAMTNDRNAAAAAAAAAPAAAPGAPSAPGRGRGRRRVEHDRPATFRPNRAGRGGRGGGLDRARGRRRRRRTTGPKQASPLPKAQKRKVKVDNVISVGQLSKELGIKAPMVIRHLMELGVMAGITEMLDIETAAIVAAEFDYEVENVGFQEKNYLEQMSDEEEEEGLASRPPVVTIMGHVDHGKTTLLDTIRDSRVAAGEAGGITQHIGAYQVETDGGLITFLDTPGHQAFSAMRARGAQITDIVVLVVAADDGVQPQTEEAIAHAKAADVPIVVAINKMDKPGVTADSIKNRLAEFELTPEEWGGETIMVPISALKAEGIDALLESILLQAEILDLRANPDQFAEGMVIEAKMERGRGAVASLLVQRGTLKRGEHVVLGSAFGKVRALIDHRGKNIKVAGPSTPVELFGLSDLPEVGDMVNAVKSEKNARALAEHRAKHKRDAELSKHRRRTAEDLFAQAAEEDRELMHLVLKADVGGTLQALRAAIEDIDIQGAEVRILHSAVGDVTESDINLAAVDGAALIGFNVKLDAKARDAANQVGVEPEFYKIIYEVLDRIEREMRGMLAPVYELVRQGTLEVRALFRISKIGTVAGSYVIDGKIGRHDTVKVVRDGREIWSGPVSTLKRFKDDVREVASGYECGVALSGFNDLQEGDLLESYAEQEVERT